MAISAMSAAETACEESGWTLTNLELQKLLYLAHMKYMGQNGGDLLTVEAFEAWKYGPVIPSLYHLVKRFGDHSISDVFLIDRNMRLPQHKMIKEVIRQFSNRSPGDLVELTHKPGGAWDTHYDEHLSHVKIPNDAILAEYLTNPF
jgi:uncharacterized phage-associated protein